MNGSGVHHFGLTVPDLDQAHDFLTDVLGFTLATRIGPVDESPDWMMRNLGVSREARLPAIHTYMHRSGAFLEVFVYDCAGQNRDVPRNHDVGGSHIALEVDDIAASHGYLLERGVATLGEPKQVKGGPLDGLWWFYFVAPWGQTFEYVSLVDMSSPLRAKAG